ncbi:hypothetical protein L6452_08002 [Arctium lappa]|uniref:Uncharacterized protein n=1 Tax=Arctium lappa TaxID=4217 RepID=A0ACB9DH56_ARCLA|nr:hypothetical protein L6452_08002 [Arctium lappa]
MTQFVSVILGLVVESLMVPVKKHLGYLFLSTEHVRNMSARMKLLEGTFDDVKNHKDTNDINTLEIPARVPSWLEEVAKIKSDAETISSNENGCFNIKARYQMGRNAWKTTQEIERLLQEGREISWTDAQKPLGRVYTKRRASTSAPSSGGGIGDDFKSRDTTFKDALKFLEKDKKNSGCVDLLIDDGVLKRLVKLEELYMICSEGNAIRFTDANVDELVGCSKNLTALAIEFTSLPNNISFEKLERFKISLGGYFDDYIVQSWHYTFENTLRLVTDKCELLDSKMYELFDKVEVFHLQVKGVNDLGYGLAESLHHRPSSFYNLRDLDICNCADLRYLFTVGVANGLKKLERLTISSCPVLETVVDGNKGGIGVIKFQALKFLSLGELPELKSLCNAVGVIELPQLKELELNGLPKFTSIYPLATSSLSSNISERQSFFNEEAVPNLEKVRIFDMENLKEIWPCNFHSSKEANACKLKEFTITRCDSLVNLFPSNPMSLLYHLEELRVKDCGSIEVLFNIDLGCVGQTTEEVNACKLREFSVEGCNSLVNLFPSNPMSLLNHLENLIVKDCGSIEVLFNIDLGCVGQTTEEVNACMLREIRVEGCNSLVNLFPSNPMSLLNHLENLIVKDCGSIEVLFNIDLGCVGQITEEVNACMLREIRVEGCNSLVNLFPSNPMSLLNHLENLIVKDCGSIEVLFNIDLGCVGQTTEEVNACMLREIRVEGCNSLVNLFPSNPMSLLNHLENLIVKDCGSIEVLFNIDLGCVGQTTEEVNACMLREIRVEGCNSLVNLFPSNPMSLLNHLENLIVKDCGSIEVLFNIDLGCVGQTTEEVNACMLREIRVEGCNSLVNLFPSNPISLLYHLENLIVKDCGSIEVLFNIDLGCVGQTTEEVSSFLRSICVMELGNLREVWRIKGADDAGLTFSGFQAIETLEINRCKRFRNVFTPTTINFDMKALTTIGLVGCGGSERDDELVKSSQEQKINVMSNEEISEVDDTILKVAFPSYLLHTCHNLHALLIVHSNAADVFEIGSPINRELAITPHKQQPRSSFHNLTTISLWGCNKIKYLFSPLMVKLISNLKNVTIWSCDVIEEVVSSQDDEDERITQSTNTSTNLVPHLDELCLSLLPKLKRIGGGSLDTNTTTTICDQFERSLKSSITAGIRWRRRWSRDPRDVICETTNKMVVDMVVLCNHGYGLIHGSQVLDEMSKYMESSVSPLCGFMALSDSFRCSWIVGLTSPFECIVLGMESWNLLLRAHSDKEKKSVGPEEPIETGDATIISKELLTGDLKAVLVPPTSPNPVAADSIEGRSTFHQYFKLFHENYVEYAHKVYFELKHHGPQLKKVIDDQHARLREAQQKLAKVEEKQQNLENRIDRAVETHNLLEERLLNLKNLPGIHKKPLSKAEKEFKMELDRFRGLELDALRTTIEAINGRVKIHSSSPQQKRPNQRRQIPGRRKGNTEDDEISNLKSSIAKLSIVNSENTKKVKLVDSALRNRESTS